MKKLLCISDLSVFLNEKLIINKFNLSILPGEVHVIMGPNGVGKSTLARVLAGGYTDYKVSGSISFNEHDLLSLSGSDISIYGLFLSFQNPVDIPGVSNMHFFKSFLNCKRKHHNLEPIETADFLSEVKSYMTSLNMKEELLNRSVNVDFSGGEKKKNEILQMLMLKPHLAILDEIDSGLDIDSLKNVFRCINLFRNKFNSILIITHYCKVSDYIDVDFVHIMCNGTIVKTGGRELFYDIDNMGYAPYS